VKVLVVAHRLELGGTQTNAIELAAAVRERHGHDVTLAAAPGPATALLAGRDVPYLELPDSADHPDGARVRELGRIGERLRPDMVHVWDWPQCFDAYPLLHLRQRRPMLCSVMTMVVPRFLPRHLATTFGTPDLARQARRRRSGPTYLLEPPVDLALNDPAAVDPLPQREAWGIRHEELALVAVSRLESWRKLEGLQRAMSAVDALAARRPIRLVVVGDGAARGRLEDQAAAVNARHGRQVVLVPGPMSDPRPAYAAADVMLGMGGSALRTMAFAKPLVVLGERGFSCVLDEQSVGRFVDQGYYGLGDGSPSDLLGQLDGLLADATRRARLGALGQAVVRDRYAVTVAADRLAGWYATTAATPVTAVRPLAEAGRTASLIAARRAATTAGRTVSSLHGTRAVRAIRPLLSRSFHE
jgi:glycosyltransferase involved in cell wall biosynthesis